MDTRLVTGVEIDSPKTVQTPYVVVTSFGIAGQVSQKQKHYNLFI